MKDLINLVLGAVMLLVDDTGNTEGKEDSNAKC